MAEKKYIVRIAGKDLDGSLSLERAVQSIKGVSHRLGRIIALTFEKETGLAFDSPLGLLPEKMDSKLEDIVLHPEKYGIPGWVYNRRKDFETGADKHLVMNELDLQLRKDVQRLGQIKSYRGLRHAWGLPVRGQRTRSSFRKGAVVGVMKKEAKRGK